MSKTAQIAYNFLMDDNEVSYHNVIRYLNSQGITPTEEEAHEIYGIVSDILQELSLVRSLKLLWDTKRYNRLVYGY